MTGTDDRHTAVDAHDRWSPGGSPPAPGWYDDPWNPQALRRWDGSAWSGETMRKGPLPDGPATPAPAPADDHWSTHDGEADAWSTPASDDGAAGDAGPTHDDRAAPDEEWAPVDDHGAAPAVHEWSTASAVDKWSPASLFAPAAAPAPTASPAVRGRPNPLLIGGIVAAVVVVIAVVVMSGHSGSTGGSTPTVAPAAPTTAGVVGMSASVLNASDLGNGWTASPPAHALTAPEYTQGPCGSAAWAHNVAGYQSSFVNGASAATAHGAVVTSTIEAPSLVIAQQQQGVIGAPAYAACLKQTVTSQVQSQLPAGSGQAVSTVTVTPFSLNLTVPNHAYVVTVTVAGPGKATRQVTDNAVLLFSGRYSARVDVSWSSDAPLAAAIVQQQSSNEAAHLQSLPS